jgi:tyrosyl-tRNA synthetase
MTADTAPPDPAENSASAPGDVLDDLEWRGLIQDSTDADRLRELLATPGAAFYCGFDPTGPSLHVGHLLQVLTARRLQQAGHRPLLLVGGATGLIGDPKPSAERSLVERDVATAWAEHLREQMEPFFDFSGDAAATMVNNVDWTSPLSTIDFLRDVGKHFSVNRMLDRDAVSRRLDSAAGISYTEFSYVLLQAHDFVQLFRRYDCQLQFGGSDQWGNITAGVDLVRRMDGAHVHAFTTPLLVKADGSKYGKTEGGTVWLDPRLTSPYSFYQYWFNVDDADVGMLLRRLTFLPRRRIEELDELTATQPARRAAQRALAAEVTTLVHGSDAVAQAEAAAAALFGRADLAAIDPRTLAEALTTVPHTTADPREEGLTTADLLVATGLTTSKGAARRAAAEGGVYVNNIRVNDADTQVTAHEWVHGRWLVLRRGRRTVAGVDMGAAHA